MRYTEALEAIYKDHSKVFRAWAPGSWETFQLDGSDRYINLTYTSIDEAVNFLSYDMMDLDWKEWAE